MPRSPRGGRGNRTDLNTATQPAKVPTGLAYGEAQQLQQSQQAAPLAQPQTPPVSLDAQAHEAAAATPPPPNPITAPTERPQEPLTHGLATGPGAGPEALAGGGAAPDPTLMVLKGIYSKWPSEDIRQLVEEAQKRAGMAGL